MPLTEIETYQDKKEIANLVLDQQEKSWETKFQHFPFSTRLSFASLLKDWEAKRQHEDEVIGQMALKVSEYLKDAPELLEPIDDYQLLEKHKQIISILIAGLLPMSQRQQQLAIVSNPFNPNGFYVTPRLQQMMAHNKDQHHHHSSAKDKKFLETFMLIRPCVEILNEFYGQHVIMDSPMVYTIKNPETGLEQYYKSLLNTCYMEIKALTPPKPLSQDKINSLLDNIDDIDMWLEAIPPSNFEFQGLITLEMIEITPEESISRLKDVLLQKDAFSQDNNMNEIQQQLRNVFLIPELRVGLTTLSCKDRKTSYIPGIIANHLLAEEELNLLDPCHSGSIYCQMCSTKAPVLVKDLAQLENQTEIEKALLKQGYRNILLSPLLDAKGEVIGVLELASPHACQINAISSMNLEEILPLFTVAIQRKQEEMKNQVDAVIREQYTAVHPSVEWRFAEAATHHIENQSLEGPVPPVESIVFKDIYPLYGQLDIVSSSTIRNEMIQADLTTNLTHLGMVMQAAYHRLEYPLFDQIWLKSQHFIQEISSGLKSNDEARIIEFLATEAHPILTQIKEKDEALSQGIQQYYDSLDPELGLVYQQRKAYEESVSRINEMISGYLEEQEAGAQKMLPHYFEKYKTDGVEFNMYIGQSLLNHDSFSYMHLRNLRLWQLIVICELTRKVRDLTDQLPVPLTTAQLILVHNTPLTIRFRMDEKQFDVDGAYNVRYEIIKKRIDKSLIEGSRERLTQSGKIAIVYSQDKERQEYEEYLEYLVRKGFIDAEIERLTLAPLQGVSGMKALRVHVK